MIDFGKRKDLLFLFVLGVLIVLVVMIFSLVMIWSPNKEEKFLVGDTSYVQEVADEYKLEKYFEQISKYLVDNDYDGLYKIVAQDYIDYSSMDIEKFKKKCNELKIMGDKLVVGSFETNEIEGYNKIYIVNALTQKEGYSLRLILREKSPRNFNISFDEFILEEKSLHVKNAENIMFDLASVRYTTTDVYYNIKLTNRNIQKVIINYNNPGVNAFVLNCEDNVLNDANQAYADQIEILPGQTVEVNLRYSLNDISIDDIKSITLVNVKLANDRLVNLEFEV